MKKHERRKPTFAEAIIPLIAMFLILSVGYGVCGFPKEAMLVLSAVVTAIPAVTTADRTSMASFGGGNGRDGLLPGGNVGRDDRDRV